MTSYIINLDCDGVLRDIVTPSLAVYKKHYDLNSNLKKEDVIDYDLYKYMPKLEYLALDLFIPFAKEIFREAPPTEEELGYIVNRLMQKNKVNIVTYQLCPEAKEYTYEWLKDYKIPYNKLIFVDTLEDRINTKADFLVDDFITNLNAAKESIQSPICYNQPYNQKWTGPRIKTLRDLGFLMR